MAERLFIGVDFDGTIVGDNFPEIKPETINKRVVEFMQKAQDIGHIVIVWTARSGEHERNAIKFLHDYKIPYDYVNENPIDEYAKRGEQGRKLFCHYYIDDRAVHVNDIESIFHLVE